MERLGTESLSRWRLGTFIILLQATLILQSCAAPQAVATFSADAQKALDQGSATFKDIHASCVRRHEDAAPIAPIFMPAAPKEASSGSGDEIPQCTVFARQGDALAKASNVLSAYFRALQQLAAFNSSTVSGPGQQAAASAAVAAQLKPVQVDSISKLANLVTELFTQQYQQRRLLHVLLEADPSITSITQGFADIASKDYVGLLAEEQQTLAARYQGVSESKGLASTLLLNRAYSEDLNTLKRRKAAAEAYVEALRSIREGHHQLAESAKRLNAKQLTAALQPYTEKLEGLLPALQQGL